jgi:hypothetical protein
MIHNGWKNNDSVEVRYETNIRAGPDVNVGRAVK